MIIITCQTTKSLADKGSNAIATTTTIAMPMKNAFSSKARQKKTQRIKEENVQRKALSEVRAIIRIRNANIFSTIKFIRIDPTADRDKTNTHTHT